MVGWLIALFVVPIITWASPSAPAVERHIALVVGNGSYEHTTNLAQAPRDARRMAETLEALGFDVTLKIDTTRSDLTRALVLFGRKLSGAKVAFVYYAGHGIQVEGVNYLVPVDARLEDPGFADSEAVDARTVLNEMVRGKSQLNVVVLDACRNNPFERSWKGTTRSFGTRGLSAMTPPGQGFVIAHATDPGDVAMDNGDYALALASHLKTPCADLPLVFDRVFDDVRSSSRGTQRPWVRSAAGERARSYFPAGCVETRGPIQLTENVAISRGWLRMDIVATNVSDHPKTLNRLSVASNTLVRMQCDSKGKGPMPVEAEYEMHFDVGSEPVVVPMDPPLQLPPGEAVRFLVALRPRFRGACERVVPFEYSLSVHGGRHVLGTTQTYEATSSQLE